MSKEEMVGVPRELLERATMRPGKESLSVNNADIIDRGRAQADIRDLLAESVVDRKSDATTTTCTHPEGRTSCSWCGWKSEQIPTVSSCRRVGFISPAGLESASRGSTAMFRSSEAGAYTIPLYTRSDAGEVDRLNTVVEQQKNLIASLRAELRDSYGIDAAVQEDHLDLEAAAKKMAACMDYPWEHMPEQGRASMREHAKAVIDTALNPKPEAANHGE
jgi:hypothetical protein